MGQGSPPLRSGAARAVLGSPLRSGAAWRRGVLRSGRGAQQPQAGRSVRAQSSRRRRSSLGPWRQSSGGPFRAQGGHSAALRSPPSALPPRVLPPQSCAPLSSLLLPPRGRSDLPASALPPSLRYGHPSPKPLHPMGTRSPRTPPSQATLHPPAQARQKVGRACHEPAEGCARMPTGRHGSALPPPPASLRSPILSIRLLRCRARA